jgi:hypothetical protein
MSVLVKMLGFLLLFMFILLFMLEFMKFVQL